MQYKIFIPNCQGARNDHLERVGIESLMSDQGPDWESVNPGPMDTAGMLCSWSSPGSKSNPGRGVPDRFVWVASPPDPVREIPREAWYFGYDPDDPPKPHEVERLSQYPGSSVTLCDKNEWLVPSAYHVPVRYGLDQDTGLKTAKIPPTMQRYCYAAFQHATAVFQREEDIKLLAKMNTGIKLQEDEEERLFRLVLDEKAADARDISKLSPEDLGVTVAFDDTLDHAWHALELNYRINPAICTFLELLDQEAIAAICCAAIDLPKIKIHLKKNEGAKQILLPGGWSI